MMGLLVTDMWEQTSRNRSVRHGRMRADVTRWDCRSLTCESRCHVMRLWVTDVWEQTSRDGSVGH